MKTTFSSHFAIGFAFCITLSLTSCAKKHKTARAVAIQKKDSVIAIPLRKAASNAEILARKEIPILCYHQIRDWKVSDSQRAHDDIIPPDHFRQHLKLLADSGYHTILPDQLYDYLVYGSKLPEKPFMITFDDTDLDQYTVALPELKKYGFKGVFFIMTVSIGRNRYMSKLQIKEMADAGHAIESHTWNHKNFARFTDTDWTTQIDEPTHTLEKITGKKIDYFAYPYGVSKASTLYKLKEHGFKAAFILSTARNNDYPLYTIRRIIDPGRYSARNLLYSMHKSFNKTKS